MLVSKLTLILCDLLREMRDCRLSDILHNIDKPARSDPSHLHKPLASGASEMDVCIPARRMQGPRTATESAVEHAPSAYSRAAQPEACRYVRPLTIAWRIAQC